MCYNGPGIGAGKPDVLKIVDLLRCLVVELLNFLSLSLKSLKSLKSSFELRAFLPSAQRPAHTTCCGSAASAARSSRQAKRIVSHRPRIFFSAGVRAALLSTAKKLMRETKIKYITSSCIEYMRML